MAPFRVGIEKRARVRPVSSARNSVMGRTALPATVLLVDDEVLILTLVADSLLEHGALSGMNAAHLLRSRRIAPLPRRHLPVQAVAIIWPDR